MLKVYFSRRFSGFMTIACLDRLRAYWRQGQDRAAPVN